MAGTDSSVAVRATNEADQALVARAGALLQANGESTSVTVAAVDRLNRGLGTDFQIVPAWASLSILDRGRDPLVTVAPPLSVGMTSVAIAMRVIDRVGQKTASRVELDAELTRAAKSGPAQLWLFVVACATGAAALSIIFGAQDATAVLLIAFSAALGGLIRRLLGRVHVGPLGQVFAAALLAGAVGGLAVHADLSTSMRLIAVCPAMILVPGPHILNGVLDLFALRISLGLARLGYSAMILLAVGAGLAVSLALLGTDLPVQPAGRAVPLWLDIAAAAVAAASYPVYFAIPYRLIALPVVVGAAAHGLRTWAMEDFGVNIAVGALIACLVVGVVMAPLSHRMHIPYAAVSFAAVVALVPGVLVFRAIDALGEVAFGGSDANVAGALSDGTSAVLIVLGMAVGLALPKQIYGKITELRKRT